MKYLIALLIILLFLMGYHNCRQSGKEEHARVAVDLDERTNVPFKYQTGDDWNIIWIPAQTVRDFAFKYYQKLR